MAGSDLPLVSMAINGEYVDDRGFGAWAAVVCCGGETRILSGRHPARTTARMELAAAVEGLEALDAPSRVGVHTESRHVFDGVSRRMETWRERGWRNADGRTISDEDLWTRLHEQCSRHQVSWTWCSRHHGPRHNPMTRTSYASHQIIEETERSCA